MKTSKQKKYILIILIIVFLIMISKMLLQLLSLIIKTAITIEVSPETSLLSVFSIVVTFWVGINIYNILDKNEIRNILDDNQRTLEDKLNQIEDKTQVSLKNNDKNYINTVLLLGDIEKESTNLTLYLQTILFRSSLDRQNTWYELFYKFSEGEEKIKLSALALIIQIEQLYNRVYRIYLTNEYFHYLDSYCEEGLELIEATDKEIGDEPGSNWRNIYLEIRKSDFLFFRAIYSIKNNFILEAENYLFQSTGILTIISNMIDEGKIGELSNLCLAKHYNTLAYSYMLLADFSDTKRCLEEAKNWAVESVSQQNGDILYTNAYRHLEIINEKLNNYDEAKNNFELILQEFPDDRKTLYCYNLLLLKMIEINVKKVNTTSYDIANLTSVIANLEKFIYKYPEAFGFKNLLLFAYTLLLKLQPDEISTNIEVVKNYLYKNSDHKNHFDTRFRINNIIRLIQYCTDNGLSTDWIYDGASNMDKVLLESLGTVSDAT